MGIGALRRHYPAAEDEPKRDEQPTRRRRSRSKAKANKAEVPTPEQGEQQDD